MFPISLLFTVAVLSVDWVVSPVTVTTNSNIFLPNVLAKKCSCFSFSILRLSKVWKHYKFPWNYHIWNSSDMGKSMSVVTCHGWNHIPFSIFMSRSTPKANFHNINIEHWCPYYCKTYESNVLKHFHFWHKQEAPFDLGSYAC